LLRLPSEDFFPELHFGSVLEGYAFFRLSNDFLPSGSELDLVSYLDVLADFESHGVLRGENMPAVERVADDERLAACVVERE